ncbi:M23 family metallopeptidase [Schlegelella sp. S2-27]|uniref:M23 family metallopeptidase n=1 Tax=Caldimonas mangrovi TaxID=2944811 RepID=A0ABT0YTM5_9BURK|nr:M23 family metallopeptidase [Caldimonas mangrovi]MCM5681749.1 M23 family metallopeptidase [Caldimonas mangrovi]
MALLAWPLERNEIRRGVQNNAFGMVRNGGTRPHQGWDLYAAPGTPCYAIADGKIELIETGSALGNMVLLGFDRGGQRLYAAYCHLSFVLARDGEPVRRGDMLGYTGNTGNAASMTGDDQHLHFEVRTAKKPGHGLGGRIDPADLYGRAPVGWTFFEGHGQKIVTAGARGLKVPGINIRESLQ